MKQKFPAWKHAIGFAIPIGIAAGLFTKFIMVSDYPIVFGLSIGVIVYAWEYYQWTKLLDNDDNTPAL